MASVASVAVVALLAGCGAPASPSSPAAPATPSVTATPASSEQPVATTRPRSVGVLQGARIGIDPGHNGLNHTRPDIIDQPISNGRGDDVESCNTTGTETNGGYTESAFTFHVATDLARLLRARGATVVLTRRSNAGVGPCVDERARILNDAHVDVAIDLHADGGPSSGRGFAILEPVPSGTNDAVVGPSLRYARLLRREFSRTGMPTSTYDGTNGLITRPDLGGLNLTTVPQLLIECGNMRNATDARLLTSARFQRAAARAILRGMRDFLETRPGRPASPS